MGAIHIQLMCVKYKKGNGNEYMQIQIRKQ